MKTKKTANALTKVSRLETKSPSLSPNALDEYGGDLTFQVFRTRPTRMGVFSGGADGYGLLYHMSDGLGWYLKEIETLPDVIRGLLPAKEGDRVIMIKPVKCEDGWRGNEHFLCVGSKATIESLGISDGKIYANLVFDNETWIDQNGKIHPVSSKHIWGFGFEYFAKLHECAEKIA
jgi:hypothetical protein